MTQKYSEAAGWLVVGAVTLALVPFIDDSNTFEIVFVAALAISAFFYAAHSVRRDAD